eukprot:gene18589-24316_t
MGDVAEILGLQSKPTSVYDETIKLLNEKPKGLNAGPKLNKKPKGMSREVFSLIGADSLVPSMQGNKPNVAFKSKRLNAIKGKWIWNSFTNSSRNDDMKLHHWAKPVVVSTVDTTIVSDNIPTSLPEYKQLSAAEIHPSTVVTSVIDYPIPGKPFLQSGRLIVNETSLKLSKNFIKKVNTLLRDLGLLEFPTPTKMVCDYYDAIRQQAVSLISIHSIIKQKEKDLQLLRSKQNIALGSLNPFAKEIKIPLSHQIVTLPSSQSTTSNSNISSYPNVLQQQVLPNEGDLVSSLGVGMILAETYNPSLSLQDTSSPNNTSKKSSKRKLPTDATTNDGDGNNNDAAKKTSKKSKKTVVKPVVSNESNEQLATSQSDVIVTNELVKEPVDIKPNV